MEPCGIFGADLVCPKEVLVGTNDDLISGKAMFRKLKKWNHMVFLGLHLFGPIVVLGLRSRVF